MRCKRERAPHPALGSLLSSAASTRTCAAPLLLQPHTPAIKMQFSLEATLQSRPSGALGLLLPPMLQQGLQQGAGWKTSTSAFQKDVVEFAAQNVPASKSALVQRYWRRTKRSTTAIKQLQPNGELGIDGAMTVAGLVMENEGSIKERYVGSKRKLGDVSV